ncbi:MAG TPA: hypothetical protein VI636_21935, partial [Candidatus Angelobacter sp.]
MKSHFERMRNVAVPLLVFTFVFAYANLAAAESAARPSAQAGASAAMPAHEVLLDDLPQVTTTTRSKPVEIPMRGPLLPNSPHAPQVISPESKLSPAPAEGGLRTTPGTLRSFNGEGELGCGGFIPSDHALATNASNEVQVINSCITVFTSTGAVVAGFPKSLNTFFGVAGDLIGDPRALYDWHSGRWIILAEDFSANNILLAASTTASPTGAYHIYSISGTTGNQLPGCADFPMMGQDNNEIADAKGAIFVSFDRFNCSSGAFIDDVVWILPKTPIYAGAGFGFNFFFNFNVGGATLDHIQPANVMGKPDQPDSEFLINTFDFNAPNFCLFPNPCN